MLQNLLNAEGFNQYILIVNIILIILIFICFIDMVRLNKRYNRFMKKVGNGKNLENLIEIHINKAEEIKKTNEEIIDYIDKLRKEINTSIKKVGLVRYNAFKDTGSDLSFALALLNDELNGIILNGIYSREMSNIYAKEVIHGECKNKLTEEEREALKKAIGTKG